MCQKLKSLREKFAYDSMTGIITWKVHQKGSRGVGNQAGSINTHYKTGKRYIFIHINGKQWRAHRLAWFLYYGVEPEFEIDHINGNGTDNSILNLRMTDTQGNSRNQRIRSTNTSGVIGVRWVKKASKWVAGIHDSGKNVHLGLFIDFEKAVEARRNAEKLYGYHKNHGTVRPL